MAATLVKPVLFSASFNVAPSAFTSAGLIDPMLNADTRLFIDPLLIHKSQNAFIKAQGLALLRKRFAEVIDLLAASQTKEDAAWRAAFRNLDLSERAETGLGYGGASTSGSSRSMAIRNSILDTAKDIIVLGEKNPNIIPLMGLFEEGVGPDTLSDMTTNYLLPVLCELTEEFCAKNAIITTEFGSKYANCNLPLNPYSPNNPVILVPKDILRDLPLAADWGDVSRVVAEIEEIRTAINKMFGDMSRASITERKAAIRKAALASRKNLRALLNALADASESYDEKADLDGFYTFRKILSEDRAKYKGLVSAPKSKSHQTLHELITAITTEFRELVENNNLWELLWHGTTPRHERASQLLFFAVSNVLCAVNDIDISPETNAGGGPVDFKFSTGYSGRVLVELKLSKGQVVSGYTKQLERYKIASKTQGGVFVIMDVGGLGNKLKVIQKLQQQALSRGDPVSSIVYIDAKRQVSASKL